MNRRNVLLGLGTAAAGSGIVFGSGAFTQLEADREVDISVEGDPEGQLGLTATSPFADDDSETGENTQDLLSLTFTDINDSADHTFEDVFQIEDNTQRGTEDGNDLELQVIIQKDDGVGVDDGGAIDFLDSGGNSIVADVGNTGEGISLEEDTESIDVTINTDSDVDTVTVTFEAAVVDPS